MQLAIPSPSDRPARLPLNTTMFGTFAAAASGIIRSASAMSLSWLSGRLKPTGIVPNPFASAHSSPCFAGTAHSFSLNSSTEL